MRTDSTKILEKLPTRAKRNSAEWKHLFEEGEPPYSRRKTKLLYWLLEVMGLKAKGLSDELNLVSCLKDYKEIYDPWIISRHGATRSTRLPLEYVVDTWRLLHEQGVCTAEEYLDHLERITVTHYKMLNGRPKKSD